MLELECRYCDGSGFHRVFIDPDTLQAITDYVTIDSACPQCKGVGLLLIEGADSLSELREHKVCRGTGRHYTTTHEFEDTKQPYAFSLLCFGCSGIGFVKLDGKLTIVST